MLEVDMSQKASFKCQSNHKSVPTTLPQNQGHVILHPLMLKAVLKAVHEEMAADPS
jgi:hypothetical protein